MVGVDFLGNDINVAKNVCGETHDNFTQSSQSNGDRCQEYEKVRLTNYWLSINHCSQVELSCQQ